MHVVVLVSASDEEEARQIAREILKERLAACVSIIPKIDSLFWWEGHIEESEEVLMIIKSRKDVLEKLISRIEELHSYQIPEIIAIPIQDGSKEYLGWLNSVISGGIAEGPKG